MASSRRRVIVQALMLFSLPLLPGSGSALLFSRHTEGGLARAMWPAEVPTVDIPQALSWGDSVVWVDARSQTDFDESHIPGAVLLNEENWETLLPGFMSMWSPDLRVIVYCSSKACHSSESAALRLRRDLGGGHIYVLKGGWEAWVQHGK